MNADLITPSSEAVIVIDALLGDVAEITTTLADTISFGAHDEMILKAPFLDFDGSFVSISGSDSVLIQTTQGDLKTFAGHDIDVNANKIEVVPDTGNAEVTASNGHLTLTAGNEIQASAFDIELQSRTGGILVQSEGHDVTLDSTGNIVISDIEDVVISITAHDDIVSKSLTSTIIVGQGDDGLGIDLTTRDSIIFDGTTSLNVISSLGSATFNAGDQVSMTAGASYLATASNQVEIRSETDGIDMFGYTSLNINAGGSLSVSGDQKGITITSSDSSITMNSNVNAVTFTSTGSNDDGGVFLNGDVSATATDMSILSSVGNAVVLANSIVFGEGYYEIDADMDVTMKADDNLMMVSDTEMSFTSSDFINLFAYDQAYGTETFSSSEIYAEAMTMTYTTSDDLVIIGGDVSVVADGHDLNFVSRDDLIFLAVAGDSDDIEIDQEASSLQITGDDVFMHGGVIALSSDSNYTYSITGDVLINAMNGDSNTVRFFSDADAVLSMTILDGDFTHETVGDVYWKALAVVDGVPVNPDITVNVGDLSFEAGSKLTDVSTFNAHDNFDISSNTTDINFAAVIINVESSDDISFDSATDPIEFSATSIYLESYDVEVQSLNVDVNVDTNMIWTTDRIESADDFIEFKFDTSIDLSATDMYFVSNGPGSFIAQTDLTIDANGDLTVTSDDFMPITIVTTDVNIDASDDITILGDEVTFSANQTTTFDMEDAIELTSTRRGLLAESGGDMVMNNTGSVFSVQTNGGDIKGNAGGSIMADAFDDFITDSDDSLSISSSNGPVMFNAGRDITVHSQQDIYMSTGASSGDTLYINSFNDTNFNADDSFSLSGPGPLSIESLSGDTVFNSATVSIMANGDYDVFSNGDITVASTGSNNLLGGDVSITSTVDDIVFTTGDSGAVSITSTESSLAAEEIASANDDIWFTSAMGDITIQSAPGSGSLTFNADDTIWITAKCTPWEGDAEGDCDPAGMNGSVQGDGENVRLSSRYFNQDMMFMSGGEFVLTADSTVSHWASADYSLMSANWTYVGAHDTSVTTSGDLTMSSNWGSILLNSTGDAVQFLVRESTIDENPVQFLDNNIEFIADGDVMGLAEVGQVLFSADGFSFNRRNQQGDSDFADYVANLNMEKSSTGSIPQLLAEPVGFSMSTRSTSGNIYVHSQYSDIDIVGDDDIEFMSNSMLNIYANDSLSVTSSQSQSISFNAQDGAFTMRGGHGYNLDIGDVHIFATGSSSVLSEDFIMIECNNDISITAETADIQFQTFLQHDVFLDTRDLTLSAGSSGTHLIAQGDIGFYVSTSTVITGDRGVYTSSNSGPVNITAESDGNEVSASEEVFLNSGGVLSLFNAGVAGEDMSFTGIGVTVSASDGDVNLASQSVFNTDSDTATFQSLGTSTTSRDRLLFNLNDQPSPDATLSFNGLRSYMDVTETVTIGLTTFPIVTFDAAGDEANDGIVINSAGNLDFNTDSSYIVESDTSITFDVVAQAKFSAFAGLEVISDGTDATDGIYFASDEGLISVSANQQIAVTTLDGPQRYLSSGVMRVQSTGVDPALEGIVVESTFEDVQYISHGLIDAEASNIYFDTLFDDRNIAVVTDNSFINFDAARDFQLITTGAGGNASTTTFTANDLLQFTAQSNDINFTSDDFNIEFGSGLETVVVGLNPGSTLNVNQPPINYPCSTFTTVNLPAISAPLEPVSDAFVTIWASGDFGATTEALAITCEGFSLGTWMDGNSANDIFNYDPSGQGDCTNDYPPAFGVIPLATFMTIAADGVIQCDLSMAPGVDCDACPRPNELRLDFNYDIVTERTTSDVSLNSQTGTFSATFLNGTSIQADIVQMTTYTENGDIEVDSQNGGISLLADYGAMLFDSLDQLEFTATAGNATYIGNYTQEFIATDSIDFTSTLGLFEMSHVVMNVETEMDEGGDIDFTATSDSILIQQPLAPYVYYYGNDLSTFIFDAAQELSVDVTNLDLLAADIMEFATSNAEQIADNDLEITASNIFTMDAGDEFTVMIGGPDASGMAHFIGNSIELDAASDLQMRLYPDFSAPEDFLFVSHFADNGDLTLQNLAAGQMIFAATGSVDEFYEYYSGGNYWNNVNGVTYEFQYQEDLGYFDIESSSFNSTSVLDSFLLVDNGGVSVNTAGNSLYQSRVADILMASHGMDTGVFFEAKSTFTFTFPQMYNAANEWFVMQAETDGGAAGSVTITSNTQYTHTQTGNSAAGQVGILFETAMDGGSFSVGAGVDLNMQAFNVEMLASDSISFSAPSDINVSGPFVYLNAEGVNAVNPDDYYGVEINSGVFTVSAADTARFTAGGSNRFQTSVSGSSFTANNDIIIDATYNTIFRTSSTALNSIISTTGDIFLDADVGIQIESYNSDVDISGVAVEFLAGDAEQDGRVKFASHSTDTIFSSATFNIDAGGNILFTSYDQVQLLANVDVNVLARRGSINFDSVILDDYQYPYMTNNQNGLSYSSPGGGIFEMTIQSNGGANEGIYLSAHYWIWHRQHQYLQFFDASSVGSRTFDNAARYPSANPGVTVYNSCRCTNSGGIDCSNVICPESHYRILQMREALLEYGLLR